MRQTNKYEIIRRAFNLINLPGNFLNKFKFFISIYFLIVFSLPINAREINSIIQASCSKNNEIWLSDIKLLVEAIRSENKKILAKNLSAADAAKLSKQFGVDAANLYDDIVFRRKMHLIENPSNNERNDRIFNLIIEHKSAVVYHAVGEILSKNHELSEIRVERIFVEKCEAIANR
jgi:hypothetical protein